jgi:hypothetical protein
MYKVQFKKHQMKTDFKTFFLVIAFILGFLSQNSQAQNSFPTDGNATIKRTNATLYIINDSESAWSRAGLVFNNPFQAVSTNFEILYEKNGVGSAGTSSALFRKNNSSGYLNYLHFNDSNNSIYFMSNKSGSQSFGNLFLLNGNFLLGANSKLGIGTNNPTEKLEVNGTIRAKEVKLEATNWPDYVFDDEYQLSSLEDVGEFIERNGHLPEFLPASEYEARGVNMLEINQQLLKKVEELTLYLLMQQNKMKEYELKFQSQENRLNALEEVLIYDR